MTTETIRAEFEAAMIKHGEDAGYDESDMKPVRDGEGYAESHTQAAWWAWQAAFESEQVQAWKKDAERLDWLIERAGHSRTGATLDLVYHAEDGRVLEKGYRYMEYHFISPLRKTARDVIDAAMEQQT